MVTAAFIVSVVAVLISLGAIRYSRDQALAARVTSRLARTPRLSAAIVPADLSVSASPMLQLIHDDGPNLDAVHVEVIPTGGDDPITGVGVDTLADARTADLGPLRTGAHVSARVMFVPATLGPPDAVRTARFLVTCRAGDDTWDVVVTADVDNSHQRLTRRV